jgi:polysaccharide export outer membrane protein
MLAAAFLLSAPPSFGQTAPEIRPGDVVHVVVLGQAALTGDFTVDPQGMMAYPFLGKVKASGMSAAELERKLTTLLADGYVRRPQVSVRIREFVYVVGEVQKPGPYPLPENRSLIALVGSLGELTPEAGHEVLVVRAPKPAPPAEASGDAAGQGEPSPPPPAPEATPRPAGPMLPGEVPNAEVLRVSRRQLQPWNPEKDVRLEVGDTVYVPKAARVYVRGHVVRPGAYPFEEGMTFYQLLNIAGGVSERGSWGKVKVYRLVDGKRKGFKVKLDDPVQPEDTLEVGERFF